MTYSYAGIQAELQQNDQDTTYELFLLDEVDSTNSYLSNQKASSSPQICLANSQTSGRGRFGKSWDSQGGNSLCMSIRLPLEKRLDQLMGFSLVVALAIKSVIQPMIRKQIQLKWPNDILIDNKKLCGVLIETQSSSKASIDLIVGIGINLSSISSAEYESISLDDCDLETLYSHDKLVADLVHATVHTSRVFDQKGFAPFKQAWLEQEQWLGTEVTIMLANGEQNTGIYSGLDERGQIEILMEDELRTFNAGEISLRRKEI